MKIRIKIKKDVRGSEDGITIQEFKQGAEYLIEEELARIFIAEGQAEEVKEETKKEETKKERRR